MIFVASAETLIRYPPHVCPIVAVVGFATMPVNKFPRLLSPVNSALLATRAAFTDLTTWDSPLLLIVSGTDLIPAARLADPLTAPSSPV